MIASGSCTIRYNRLIISKLFLRCEPEETAEHVLGVVERLEENQRGRVWDWAGEEVIWFGFGDQRYKNATLAKVGVSSCWSPG